MPNKRTALEQGGRLAVVGTSGSQAHRPFKVFQDEESSKTDALHDEASSGDAYLDLDEGDEYGSGGEMDNEEDEESGEDDEDEVEDYALLEEDEPISVWSLRRIADRDATMTEEEKKKLKKTDAGIDDWIRKYLREQYERIDASVKQLATQCAPIVKQLIAQEAKGLFTYDHSTSRLEKAFPFRSSFRDIFLGNEEGSQPVDKALALLLSASGPAFRAVFTALVQEGPTGTLMLDKAFDEGTAASRAVKEVGLYLRHVPEHSYYCGISRDIAQRQRGHNGGAPGTQGNRKMRRALNGRPASDIVVARRLASFGKTGLSECPQPILNAVETIVICSARLTTTAGSLQVNVIDTPPFVAFAKSRPNSKEARRGEILAQVWKRLYDYHEDQKADFARGRYMRYGMRPVPVGPNGIDRADKEAKVLIIPIIRDEDVGQAWVMANLFRNTTYEENGVMIERSPFAALEAAKASYPIPSSAFFKSLDTRQQEKYRKDGYPDVPAGHYPSWAKSLTGENGFKVQQPKREGQAGGIVGLPGQSSLSAEEQEKTYQQCRLLWERLNEGGVF